MSSEDLLNQPIPDDDEDTMKAGSIIEDFLSGGNPVQTSETQLGSTATQSENTDSVRSSGKPVESGPGESKRTAPKNDASMSDLDHQLARAQEQLDMTMRSTQERYKKRLADAGISMSEARRIIDCVMVQLKPWTETYIVGSNTRVKFQTRLSEDYGRLRNVIESREAKFQATRNFEATKHNLAASILRYGDHEFDHESRENTGKILDWIDAIPYPLFNVLGRKLYEFDRKITIVFSEGFDENF